MACDHPHSPKEALGERIRACGLKLTPSRLKVLELLEKSRCLMSIDELVEKLSGKSEKKRVDWTTIYRTVLSFKEAGLVQDVMLEDGVTRYEFLCEAPDNAHHHHHVRCRKCGKISPIEVCEIRKIERAIEALGYTELSHRLEFSGLCRACRAASKGG
jgi:Fur family ferric uptake transcriptional regulator